MHIFINILILYGLSENFNWDFSESRTMFYLQRYRFYYIIYIGVHIFHINIQNGYDVSLFVTTSFHSSSSCYQNKYINIYIYI